MQTVHLTNIYKQKLTLVKGDYITHRINKRGIYDEAGLSFIRSFLLTKKRPIAVDIGSNVGNHALVMSRCSDRVIAFEPQNNIYKLLVENIKTNNIDNIETFNFGLSNEDKVLEFNQNIQGNSGASSFMHNSNSPGYKTTFLPVKKGDEVFSGLSLEKVDLIKMDVEGFEPFVLLGLEETIKKYQPVIVLEWGTANINEDFIKYQIMEKVLAGYNRLGIISNYDSSLFSPGLLGKVKKEIYKQFTPKIWATTPFIPSAEYNNAIFFPEKMTGEITKLRKIPLHKNN